MRASSQAPTKSLIEGLLNFGLGAICRGFLLVFNMCFINMSKRIASDELIRRLGFN